MSSEIATPNNNKSLDASVESDDDEEDYGAEEGEFDKDGDIAIPDDVLERLDPEIREKYKNGEIS